MVQTFISRFRKPGLARRVAVGSGLSLLSFGTTNVLRLGSNLILTRLLVPEAFGLMALVTSIMALLQMMSDLGLRANVIRSDRAKDKAFLGTVWLVQVARGVLVGLFLVTVSFALIAAVRAGMFSPESVYRDPRTPSFLWIAAGAMVLRSLASTRPLTNERDLKMSWVFGSEVAAAFIGSLTAVFSVLAGAGAYGLVLGIVGNSIAQLAISYIMPGRDFRVAFRMDYFWEIFHFGKWLTVSSFFTFVVTKGDQIFFGNALSARDFGFYAIATIWVSAGRLAVQQLQRRVGMPAFSEISRKRPEGRTVAYYRMRTVVDLLVIAIFVAVVLGAEIAFDILYSRDYSDVAYYARLLSVSLLLAPLTLFRTILLSEGQSRKFWTISLTNGLALIIGLPIIHRLFGIEFAISYAALIEIFAMPLMWIYARGIIKLNLARELALPVIAVASAGIIVAAS